MQKSGFGSYIKVLQSLIYRYLQPFMLYKSHKIKEPISSFFEHEKW